MCSEFTQADWMGVAVFSNKYQFAVGQQDAIRALTIGPLALCASQCIDVARTYPFFHEDLLRPAIAELLHTSPDSLTDDDCKILGLSLCRHLMVARHNFWQRRAELAIYPFYMRHHPDSPCSNPKSGMDSYVCGRE